MCAQSNRKGYSQRVIDRGSVYQGGQDTDVPQSPQYHQDVRLFRRQAAHLHRSGDWHRRATLLAAETQ